MISMKSPLLLSTAALAFLGNYVTTAQIFTTFNFQPKNACEQKVNHKVFSLGREVSIDITSFFDPVYGTMQIEFGNDAGIYAGTTAVGWCVDIDRFIGLQKYKADTYSTYNKTGIPNGAVDKIDNLDLVNWLVNEYYIGKSVDGGGTCSETKLTWKEIQTAIWQVIDNTIVPSGMFGSDPCIIDYMVKQTMAAANEDWEPCCDSNEKIAAMLVIDSDSIGGATTGTITKQVIIAEMPLFHVRSACRSSSQISAGAKGDPHFKTWAGEMYDFHGVCDLVLLKNPDYKDGLGMNIHIRTQKTRNWSYISSAIIQIGDEFLEVMGGKENKYWVNGVTGDEEFIGLSISGHPIKFQNKNEKSRKFEIDLGSGSSIVFQTWHEMVRVDINDASSDKFIGSLGLMGSYPTGVQLARDNRTVIEDENVFGQEWQVLASERSLFHKIDGPQAPMRCEIPTKMALRRRLSYSTVTIEAAESACKHIKDKEEFDICVFDVMATNDENVAGAY